MSIVSKMRTIYLAVPLMLGLSACTPSKTFVLVNGPKDLEYRLGDHSPAMIANVNRGIDNIHRHDFEMRFIPYKSLDKHDNMRPMDEMQHIYGMRGDMPHMRGMDGMRGTGRMNDRPMNNMPPKGRMPNMYNMPTDTTHYMKGMNGMGRGRMNGMPGMNSMQRGMPNRMNGVSREDVMKYRNLMHDYKDNPEAIGEMMPMNKVNDIRNMEMQGMRGGMYGRMGGMDRMHNMYRGNLSDSSMFRPHMRNDTVRQMYRMQHIELMQKNMPKK